MPTRNGFGIIDPILEVPGIDIWFDPADVPKITFNGSKVLQIGNKSGNPTVGRQATAVEQPSTDTRSGKNVIRFEGGTKLTGLDLNTISTLTLGTQMSLSMVITRTGDGNAYVFSGTGTSGSPAILSKFTNNEIEYFNSNGGGPNRATFADVEDDDLHIITLTVDDAANYTGYFDGVQQFDAPTGGATIAGVVLSVLGHPDATGFNGYDGFMGDVILSGRRIWSATEIDKIELRLSNKWGINI